LIYTIGEHGSPWTLHPRSIFWTGGGWQLAAANRSLHQQSTAADFVFPATRGQGHAVGVRKVFESICKEAKLENLRIHDLRHSFASFAIADGASFFWWPNFLAMRVPEPRSDMRI